MRAKAQSSAHRVGVGWEGPGGARGGLGHSQVPDQGDRGRSLAGTDGGPGPACVLQAVTDVVACDVIELFFHNVTNAFLFLFSLFVFLCFSLQPGGCGDSLDSDQFAALDFTIKGYFLRANESQKCLLIVW